MNLNKFFTLFMGKCWHEWKWIPGDRYRCMHCDLSTYHYGYSELPANPDYTSNPLPVLEWMREHMPDTLEKAIAFIWQDYEINETFTEGVFRILDLKNLYAYLKEHPSWGEKECPNKIGNTLPYYCHPINCGGKPCHGSGTIVHPALAYAREEVT